MTKIGFLCISCLVDTEAVDTEVVVTREEDVVVDTVEVEDGDGGCGDYEYGGGYGYLKRGRYIRSGSHGNGRYKSESYGRKEKKNDKKIRKIIKSCLFLTTSNLH